MQRTRLGRLRKEGVCLALFWWWHFEGHVQDLRLCDWVRWDDSFAFGDEDHLQLLLGDLRSERLQKIAVALLRIIEHFFHDVFV